MLIAVVGLLGTLLTADVPAQTVQLNSFEGAGALSTLTANNVQLVLSDQHATEGAQSLEVHFQVTDWPNVFFNVGKGYDTPDWQPYGTLLFDVLCPEDLPLEVCVRIDDDAAADGGVHCRQTGVTIPPQKQVTVALPLKAADTLMRGLPPAAAGYVNGDLSGRAINLGGIVAFQFFLARPKEPHTLFIDNVRLGPGPDLTGIVDRFGQYAGGEWPGKVHDEAELQAQRTEEAEQLRVAPRPAGRDKWGGWAKGPQLRGTGSFRTEKVGGKWWLVTPSGHIFWSAGLDCVNPGSWGPVKGREALFSWLPEKDDPLHAYGGRGQDGVDFYGINVNRKYGPDWLTPWINTTRDRMATWGFNTVGNWSDDRSCAQLRVPYTVAIHYGGVPTITHGGGTIADFYTPQWAEAVEGAIRSVTDKWREDPYCLGYFVDNELAWDRWDARSYSLVVDSLALPGDLAVKQAFAKLLRDRYTDIANLNAAWGTQFASWEVFVAEPVALPGERTKALQEDLGLLLTDFAKRYFSVVSRLMKQYAPHQLYLGSRFSVAPDEVVATSKDYCDVVTYNIYGQPPGNILARGAQAAGLDTPVLIGEFHFGALDRGMFHGGLGPVANQEERGKAYALFVSTALAQPWCVGAHWFTYGDEPLVGRSDGENYNIGFVSNADTPYPELIAHAKEANFGMYELRGK